MAKLTQHQRDSLPEQVFALPAERRFPMPNRVHVKLAWDMVDRAKGLTDAQRATARRNILKRAHELGVDTSKWDKSSLAASEEMDETESGLTAASAPRTSGFLTDDEDHPNKMPFAGVMTWFDVPSDNPPHGSNGRNVLIPSDIGVPALDSLVGMAVNFVAQGDWSNHNKDAKVGVITSAYPGESDEDGGIPVIIEGYIYAQDFPEEAMAIKLNQHLLGFSYETGKTFLADGEFNGQPVAVTTELGYFTGASILLKDKAAYTNTSLAASADTQEGSNHVANEMKPEHAQAIQRLKAAIKQIDSITDAIMSEYGIPDADKDGKVDAAANDDAQPAGDDANQGMDASTGEGADLKPNGDDPATGTEVPALQASGDATTEPATPAEPSAEPTNVDASASTEPAAVEPATTEPEPTSLDAASQIAALESQVADLRTQLSAASANRTSIAYPNMPVSKMDTKPTDELTSLMASIDADESLTVEERLAKKFEVRDRMRSQAVK